MRWLFYAFAACFTFAQSSSGDEFSAAPTRIRQGEVLRVTAKVAGRARMNGRVINLFPQAGGGALGLMPVPVLETPGSYQLDFLDRQGSVLYSTPVTVLDAHYAKQNIAIQQSIATLKPSPGEQDAVNAFRHDVLPDRYWGDRLTLPVAGCLTSPFGFQRLYNGKPTGDYHAGLDQRGAEGTPIHAAAGGMVRIARVFNLRGGTVAIDHGQGLETIYMHMSTVVAQEGNRVQAGDIIGTVGATGRATGPHLHWTLYANGEPVYPGQWTDLPPSCSAAKHQAAPKTRRRPVSGCEPLSSDILKVTLRRPPNSRHE